MDLCFDKMGGLVPAIVQDFESGEVLMLGFMDKEAFERTIATGKACYYSRSRKKQWMKGETSGNVQMVKEIYVDCDEDTVLLKIEQVGRCACHTGYRSCFYRKLNGELTIVGEKIIEPEKLYG